jgi:hypothetical protein
MKYSMAELVRPSDTTLATVSINKLVHSRRLEDKIRHLCALATVTNDEDAWLVLSELRILLRQHVEHLRTVAAGKLSGEREFAERRDSSHGKPSAKPLA